MDDLTDPATHIDLAHDQLKSFESIASLYTLKKALQHLADGMRAAFGSARPVASNEEIENAQAAAIATGLPNAAEPISFTRVVTTPPIVPVSDNPCRTCMNPPEHPYHNELGNAHKHDFVPREAPLGTPPAGAEAAEESRPPWWARTA